MNGCGLCGTPSDDLQTGYIPYSVLGPTQLCPQCKEKISLGWSPKTPQLRHFYGRDGVYVRSRYYPKGHADGCYGGCGKEDLDAVVQRPHPDGGWATYCPECDLKRNEGG